MFAYCLFVGMKWFKFGQMDKSSSFVKGSCCGVAEKYSQRVSYIGGV